ncbi:4'-phosphopantetheinyl transferase family protein [Zooshikella harenae]|uniref:4'-phosphopantetheinyl transferase superfamily protein n=1 Tax=Zooshikella harenae TaxID=2827238 RepID=A0ABS5ZHA4_9GAMM|nr:4'-phosphopantetheinyl transferase superfamily protein [Zooshikella harenae]MBU2713438.1 4'-phosphopantetheinyl transferase superfamily protein [Zooshikella harenae]
MYCESLSPKAIDQWQDIRPTQLYHFLKCFGYATNVVYIPYKRSLSREEQGREAHCWLQAMLATLLEVPKHCLRFKRTSFGEPYIPGVNIGFNISHCSQGLLIGISPESIGVDIAWFKKRLNLQALHERTSHPDLLTCYPEPAVQDILTFWSGKEAVLKAAGVGLKIEPSKLKMKLYKSLIYQVVYVGRKPYWLTWLPQIADMIFSLSLTKRSPLLLWKICSQ